MGQRVLAVNQESRIWPAGLRAWVTPREYQYIPDIILINNNERGIGKELIIDRLNYRCYIQQTCEVY